ncbi:MAG: hypothetical protein ACLSUW_03450 [Akkermansia sp.]
MKKLLITLSPCCAWFCRHVPGGDAAAGTRQLAAAWQEVKKQMADDGKPSVWGRHSSA